MWSWLVFVTKHFTRTNKISCYSEESLGVDAVKSQIKRYKDLIKTYKEHQKVLDQNLAMVKQNDSSSVIVTANDVLELVKELYNLELTGKDIRNFYDKQEEIRKAEIITKTEKVFKPMMIAPSSLGFFMNIFNSLFKDSNKKASSSNNPEHAVPAQ